MTNLDSIFKSRDITLPTKVNVVKAMVFPVVTYGCESWTVRKLSAKELMLLNCGVGEDSWESLGLQDPTSPFWKRLALRFFGRNDTKAETPVWSLATSCEELTLWKRLWCWEGLRAGGEGDDRGWDVWMASLTRWTWVWVNSGSWWWTGRPEVLQFMGSQRVGHDWVTELNWNSSNFCLWMKSYQPNKVLQNMISGHWQKHYFHDSLLFCTLWFKVKARSLYFNCIYILGCCCILFLIKW